MNQEKNKIITNTLEKDLAPAEFSRFYLEQDSQKSNVYFATARAGSADPSATLYYKVISGKVVYKKSRFKMAVSLAAFLVTAVSFAALFYFPSQKMSAVADNSVAIEKGFDDILSAQKALAELRPAQSFFDFNAAYQKLQSIKTNTTYLSSLALDAAEYFPFIVSSGGDKEKAALESDVAQAGMAMAKSIEPILKAVQSFTLKKDPNNDINQSLSGVFSMSLSEMKNAQNILNNTQKKLENSGEEAFSEIALQLRGVSDHFSHLISGIDFAGWVLGADHQRNFLVVVENTGQARATGGAIISVGLITIENGYVSKISFDDVYNIDGQLQTKVIPPGPIQKTDTAWGIHNANWFLDFPTSAKKISYFYQKSQGVSPDGVIVLNEKSLEKLLKLIGAIELPKYDLTIDSDNFKHLTAFNIADEKRANQAKRVFNDAADLIFKKIISLPEDKMADLLRLSKENAINKDMLVWLNEEKYERVVLNAYWGGEVLAVAPDADYLSVAATDLSGAGDGSPIARNVSKQTEITNRGEVISTVVVERRRLESELSIGKEDKKAFEYIRLYVPDGSELISASGVVVLATKTGIDYTKSEFKTDPDVVFSEQDSRIDPESGTQIFRESSKTVFGAWVNVSSGNHEAVTFKYKLPFLVKYSDNLDFVFQKQPGVEGGLNFKVSKSGSSDSIFSYSGDFTTDLFFNVTNPLFHQ